MPVLNVEHIACNVSDPVKMAAWYVEHLGMKVIRSVATPPHIHFLADAAGRAVLEIYSNAADAIPDYAAMHPLRLHVAFKTDDPEGAEGCARRRRRHARRRPDSGRRLAPDDAARSVGPPAPAVQADDAAAFVLNRTAKLLQNPARKTEHRRDVHASSREAFLDWSRRDPAGRRVEHVRAGRHRPEPAADDVPRHAALRQVGGRRRARTASGCSTRSRRRTGRKRKRQTDIYLVSLQQGVSSTQADDVHEGEERDVAALGARRPRVLLPVEPRRAGERRRRATSST